MVDCNSDKRKPCDAVSWGRRDGGQFAALESGILQRAWPVRSRCSRAN